eukprot:TRINITY_DN17744_c0_g1_i1.p1 TRINITY_DN17744_c0_g1~~TRINITY_DN17744_c0_g1_i1.p1  ORF type:complete len:1187 (-),score=193.92 TRINITY_DN17744_c0_g1_i1:252-3812(-)
MHGAKPSTWNRAAVPLVFIILLWKRAVHALEPHQQVHSTCCAFLVFNEAAGIGQCTGDPKFGGECSSVDFEGASVYSNEYAFLAVNKATGKGECWGDWYYGGDCSHIDFTGVTKVYSTFGAFLALNEETGVGQCWGAPYAGGNCTTIDFMGVDRVYSNKLAFLALRGEASSGQCWGEAEYGGNCSSIDFAGVTDVYSNKYGRAFLALDRERGIGQCWGSDVSGNCSAIDFRGVSQVYSNGEAFVAVDDVTGTGRCWGDAFHGGDCSAVDFRDIDQVYATHGAFLALYKGGESGRCWGDTNYGGNCSLMDFTSVSRVYPTNFAFLAVSRQRSQCSGHSPYCRSLTTSMNLTGETQMFWSHSALLALSVDKEDAAGQCWERYPKYFGRDCTAMNFSLLLEAGPTPVPSAAPTPAPTEGVVFKDFVEFWFELDYETTDHAAFKEELRMDFVSTGKCTQAEAQELVIILRPGSIIAMTYGNQKIVERLRELDPTQVVVMNASARALPSALKIFPEWLAGAWQPCSNMCGAGVQKREVSCSYEHTELDNGACAGLTRPEDTQFCEVFDGCEYMLFCPLGPGHLVQCEVQSASIFFVTVVPLICGICCLLRCLWTLYRRVPPKGPSNSEIVPKEYDEDLLDFDIGGGTNLAEALEPVPKKEEKDEEIIVVWPDDFDGITDMIKKDAADRSAPRNPVAASMPTADVATLALMDIGGSPGSFPDDLEPAFELGAAVEYYSAMDGCWLHARVIDIRERQQSTALGQAILEYDITTLAGMSYHRDVPLEILQLPLGAEEPCAVFSPMDDRWIDAWIHEQEAGEPNRTTYTARSSAGLVMKDLPRSYVRRRFPEDSLVLAFCGEQMGWMKGKVLRETEALPQDRSSGQAGASRAWNFAAGLLGGGSSGQAGDQDAARLARSTLVTVVLDKQAGQRELSSCQIKFQDVYIDHLRHLRSQGASLQTSTSSALPANPGDAGVIASGAPSPSSQAEQTLWLPELGGSKETFEGLVTFSDGSKYEGQFSGQRKHGRGKYRHADGYTYDGDWVNDVQEGSGVERLADGSVYEGEFRGGQKTGQGKFTFSTGGSYDGAFLDDQMHGQGSYTWSDGRAYSGHWMRNTMHGTGVMTWQDGRKYTGQFVEGQFGEGKGRMEWPTGKSYEGQWRNGKQHGRGVATAEDGRKRKTEWDDGNFVRGVDAT